MRSKPYIKTNQTKGMKTTLGIDPGVNGGIAWITGGKPCVEKMPDTKGQSKTWFHHQTLNARFPIVLLRKKEEYREQEGERFRLHKGKDFSDRCYGNRSQYDGLLLHHEGAYQSSFPSLICVRKLFLFLRSGGLASITLSLFCHLILFFWSLLSMRNGSDLIVIQSSISYRMWISHWHGIFGKLAKEPDCCTDNTARISSKIFDLSASPWLFFFHKNDHLPLGKWFFPYKGKILAGYLF